MKNTCALNYPSNIDYNNLSFSMGRVVARIRQLLDVHLAPLRPMHCMICNIGLRAGSREVSAIRELCSDCYRVIPWIRQVSCIICGRSIHCLDCSRGQQRQYMCSRSAVEYSPLMKEWLADYKYRGNEKLGPVFAHMLQYGLRRLLRDTGLRMEDFRCLTFVPVSEDRLRERGFNQAEQLARELSLKTGIPAVSLLRRTRHTSKQSSKSRSSRLSALQGAFIFQGDESKQSAWSNQVQSAYQQSKREQSAYGGRSERTRVILVDDVYTTGSTLHECSRILRQHMHAEVYGLTWAR